MHLAIPLPPAVFHTIEKNKTSLCLSASAAGPSRYKQKQPNAVQRHGPQHPAPLLNQGLWSNTCHSHHRAVELKCHISILMPLPWSTYFWMCINQQTPMHPNCPQKVTKCNRCTSSFAGIMQTQHAMHMHRSNHPMHYWVWRLAGVLQRKWLQNGIGMRRPRFSQIIGNGKLETDSSVCLWPGAF